MGWLGNYIDSRRKKLGLVGRSVVVGGVLLAFFDWWQRIEFAVEHRTGIAAVLAHLANLLFSPWFGWALAAIGATLLVGLSLRSDRGPGTQTTKPSRFRKSRADPELPAFIDTWAQPAFEAARTLLEGARSTVSGSDDPILRDLAGVYQRTLDDAATAFGGAVNIVSGNASGDPIEALGNFHYQYQAMRTWIQRGATDHAAIDPASFWYREWRERDTRLLDELRRLSADPKRRPLLEAIRRSGWGEGVTHRLPPGADTSQYVMDRRPHASSDESTQYVRRFEALTEWSIHHGLGRHPTVRVLDHEGNEVVAGVKYLDDQEVIVSFGEPESGEARLFEGEVEVRLDA